MTEEKSFERFNGTPPEKEAMALEAPVAHVDQIDNHLEHKTSVGYVRNETDLVPHPKTQLERRLLWKTDLTILPISGLLFLTAYMDRNSIGNARLIGMQKDLQLTDTQFYNCLMMFFVGYIVFMLPGSILLRIIGPNRLLGITNLLFGICTCCLAVAPNYATVLALRILIGFLQSLNTGTSVYFSLWYKRNEIAIRFAIVYAFATVSGVFSGLIAYGAQKNLNGVDGKHSWQWLFIIEGVCTVGLAIAAWLFLPPFPDQIKKNYLFSEEELKLACTRMEAFNVPGARIKYQQIWVALKDPKFWLFCLMNGGIALGISSIGNFLPTLIGAFGYNSLDVQLFSAIPYACTAVTLLVVNYLSDRFNKKGIFLLGCVITSCIGYIILIAVQSVPVKIFGTCLVAMGVYPAVVLLVAWMSINIGGYTKRATFWAGCEVFSQCCSIIGTHIYIDPPRYITGHAVVLGFLAMSAISAIILMVLFSRANAKKSVVEQEHRDRNDLDLHPHISQTLEDVQDDHVFFRYIL